ncbi:tetratricopeptide repeat-containing sensor histidine kinase [Flavobacterium sp.]|uniref:tetratricopeptide repeat-containing sensor histidine kinase n=1 Tax=Flavobacterium sp. TaxID=239 RepID=UPI002FD8A180
MKYLFYILLFISYSCNKREKSDNIPRKKNNQDLEIILSTLKNNKLTTYKKKALLDKAFDISKSQANTKKNRDNISSIIFEYFYINDFEYLRTSSNTLIEKSSKAKDSVNLGIGFRFKAYYYKNERIFDSSFYYYSKAEKLYFKTKDNLNYANVLLNKGNVLYNTGDYLGAELAFRTALNILRNSTDKTKIYEVLNSLGNVSDELKDHDKAIYYYNEALNIVNEYNLNENTHRKSILYNNLGYTYQNLNNHKQAIINFKNGLKDKEIRNSFPELYANLTDNLAYSNFKIRNYKELPKKFFEALKIRDSIKTASPIVLSQIHLSEFYFIQRDTLKSQKFAKLAYNLSTQSKTPSAVLLSLQQLSNVDRKNSSNYTRKYITLSDSLQLAERKSRDRFNRIKLETDEIIQEKDDLVEKNRTLLYVFVVSFIVVVLLFVVRAQRARTRELLYKQAQQKANEDIYNLMMSQQAIIDESRNKEKKRLAQDLHDGVLGRMFGLRLNLDSLNSNTDTESAQRRLELLNELKTIEQDIREISHDLNREKQVLINNFVSIVHNLLEEQKTSHEANLNYSIDNDVVWDKVANAIKINMYRILQEGLQNINKYANAKNISVEIKGDKENVYLKIQDDGIGFDVTRKSKGIGMQNMISRTHDCLGIIDISSKKNEGTKIVITLPIESKQLIVEHE